MATAARDAADAPGLVPSPLPMATLLAPVALAPLIPAPRVAAPMAMAPTAVACGALGLSPAPMAMAWVPVMACDREPMAMASPIEAVAPVPRPIVHWLLAVAPG